MPEVKTAFARLEAKVELLLEVIAGMKESKDFYTVDEFAEKVNTHPDTIRRRVNSGEIKAKQDGPRKAIRIPATELQQYKSTITL